MPSWNGCKGTDKNQYNVNIGIVNIWVVNWQIMFYWNWNWLCSVEFRACFILFIFDSHFCKVFIVTHVLTSYQLNWQRQMSLTSFCLRWVNVFHLLFFVCHVAFKRVQIQLKLEMCLRIYSIRNSCAPVLGRIPTQFDSTNQLNLFNGKSFRLALWRLSLYYIVRKVFCEKTYRKNTHHDSIFKKDRKKKPE